MSALPANRMAERIATLGGLGHLPGAPGTYASLFGVVLASAAHLAGGFGLLLAVTLLTLGVGLSVTHRVLAARDTPHDDPSEVVIDEVAGQLVAFFPLSLALGITGAAPGTWPWPGVLAAFVLFRLFDILKPPPVSWAERLPGTWGVMADDIVAGALAALVALIAAGVAHGWF